MEKLFAAIGMASKEPNALSVLKFMRYFARVCKLWFNDIVQKRTDKLLGTTDINARYVSDSRSFHHPERDPLSQPAYAIVSQPPKYFFLSKEIARSLRETDVTIKDVERAWLFYKDVGVGFQIGKVRQYKKFAGTKPMAYYQAAPSVPRVFSSSASGSNSTSTRSDSESSVQHSSTMPSATSTSNADQLGRLPREPEPPTLEESVNAGLATNVLTTNAANKDLSEVLESDSATIPQLNWVIITVKATNSFYVGVTEVRVNLSTASPSARIDVRYAYLDHDFDPIIYVLPEDHSEDVRPVKISDIICLLPDTVAVPDPVAYPELKLEDVTCARVYLEVKTYVEPIMDRLQPAPAANAYAKKYNPVRRQYRAERLNRVELAQDLPPKERESFLAQIPDDSRAFNEVPLTDHE